MGSTRAQLPVVLGIAVVLGAVAFGLITMMTRSEDNDTQQVRLLVQTAADDTDERIRQQVLQFKDAGYLVTEPDHVSDIIAHRRVEVFIATRSAAQAISDTTWQQLTREGAIVGGLDFSADDLTAALYPGTATGASNRLRYDPELPPIFVLRGSDRCGYSMMSDWMKNWPVHLLVEKAQQDCPVG